MSRKIQQIIESYDVDSDIAKDATNKIISFISNSLSLPEEKTVNSHDVDAFLDGYKQAITKLIEIVTR